MASKPLFLVALAPGGKRGSTTTVLLVLGAEGDEQLTADLVCCIHGGGFLCYRKSGLCRTKMADRRQSHSGWKARGGKAFLSRISTDMGRR